MPIPKFPELLYPALKLVDGDKIKLVNAVKQISDDFALTPRERIERMPSGGKKIWHRVRWALAQLSDAGLVDRPSHGYFIISEKGKTVLKNPPKKLDMSFLSDLSKFDNVDISAKRKPKKVIPDDTPEERISAAIEEIEETMKNDLMESVMKLSSKTFEELAVGLLVAMGYGDKGASKHTGGPGDGGVDGIIYEDPLGLYNVSIQAKKPRKDSYIRPNQIREFVGSLDPMKTRGVFVTTAEFTKQAREEAEKSNVTIKLIDGNELISLMFKFGLGVREHSLKTTVKCVNQQYFEELMA